MKLTKVDVSVSIIENKIYMIRGRKVMIDFDLALLYGAETRTMIQAVKRNLRRFPSDFMFQLSLEEYESLTSQIVMSNKGRGGRRHLSFVFTEQGVAMLSSVLNSNRAIDVNIQIMRVFTKLREMMLSHKDLTRKIEDLERNVGDHDKKIVLIFEAIKRLVAEKEAPPKPKLPFGFHVPKNK